MGRVVLSKEDIKKLDRLINMFEEQKKKFEKQKKEYQDGIIDCDSSTDIILYDAYIVLGKLIKKLPDVEGSDVFQDFVNVVLNDLLGDFSKLEDWCNQMLNTTSSLFNSVTENYNDMIDLDFLAEELSQMHNIPTEKINIGNDSPKIMKLLSVMFSLVNDQELRVELLLVYKFMYRIISLWPQLFNDTSKITLDQIRDIYSSSKFEERVNKNKKEILDLVPDDTVNNIFDSLDIKNLLSLIKFIGERLQEKINNGTYSDNDKAIASSIVLICNQICKCLESYIKAEDSCCKYRDIRGANSFSLIDKLKNNRDEYCFTGKFIFANDLISVYDLLHSLSLLIDWKNHYIKIFPESLDVFSACAAFYMQLYDEEYDEKNYASLLKDIVGEVQNLSIDEKIDYYLEHMAKYRGEMIKENGDSLVNVLKARMEQLDNTGVTNGDSLEQGPKGRTSR